VAVARAALEQLDLERVLLMPANASPFKAGAPDPGPGHRLQMCRLACEEQAAIAACGLEIERGGVSFSVDTLRSIHASHPDADLSFVLGADTAVTLPSWREPRALLALARIAVAARTGSARRGVLDALAAIGPEEAPEAPGPPTARVSFLEMAPVEISSSGVRERVAAGLDVTELVGPRVAGYIARHGLYAAAGTTA
jgi:nicotinate-nucleotide adenylyltransferase